MFGRVRWYCVGVVQDIDDGSYQFPYDIPCAKVDLFLETADIKQAQNGMPPESQGLARANVHKALCALKRGGQDPYKETFLLHATNLGRGPVIDGVHCRVSHTGATVIGLPIEVEESDWKR